MNVKTFNIQSRCKEYLTLEKFVSNGDFRRLTLHKAIKLMIVDIVGGRTKNKILSNLSSFLQREYEEVEFSFAWQKKAQLEQDEIRFARFLDWYDRNELEVIESHVATAVETDCTLPDGTNTLEGMVDLVLKNRQGQCIALIFHAGMSSKSLKGRSMQSNATFDLEPMMAKLSLEKEFPGITIGMVYIAHSGDTFSYTSEEFNVSDTASSNLHRISYKQYYSEDIFDEASLLNAFNNMVKAPVEQDCSKCRFFSLCKTEKLKLESNAKSEEKGKGYVVPKFTEEQQQVIHHFNGPMRVCAGPGSGKTATLIGRIRYLIEDKGIMPEFILVVTFTNEAADELRNRCLSFLEEDNLPRIATLNGFAYSILRDNKALLGRPLNVLSMDKRYALIKNLSSVFPCLKGFKYGAETGAYSIYKTIAGRIDQLHSLGEAEFFSKYPDCGDDFIEFVQQYDIAVEQNGFITFDQQITLANELFEAHPDILEAYQSIYQYIMVDEYQDVNEAQVKLVYALAAKSHNLVIVGDDDQGIYGFRGGNSRFMLDFDKDFPEAKTVVFKDNFRSTSALVDSAKTLIVNNKERIEKDIRSGRVDNSKNLLPVKVPSMQNEVIESIIEGLLEEGYGYGDIAILSSKNAPLEQLHDTMSVPTVLAKSFLRNDGFFLLLQSILSLCFEDDDRSFYQYMRLYGLSGEIKRDGSKTLMESLLHELGLESIGDIGAGKLRPGKYATALSHLYTYMCLVAAAGSIAELIENMKIICVWEDSNSPEALIEGCEKAGITDTDALRMHLLTILQSEGEERVDINRGERILLSTSHDSKGKEFPIVILRNDFSGKNEEEVRRLFYVAMTRAKEQLFILQDNSSQKDFMPEIPHITMEV